MGIHNRFLCWQHRMKLSLLFAFIFVLSLFQQVPAPHIITWETFRQASIIGTNGKKVGIITTNGKKYKIIGTNGKQLGIITTNGKQYITTSNRKQIGKPKSIIKGKMFRKTVG